jgi:hypothetical protein
MASIGVQMQPIVVAPPDRADGARLFEDRGAQYARPQRRRRGEPGRTGADDDCVDAFIDMRFSA